MSLTEAAKTYQIPKTTLHDKWNTKYKGEGIGRKPALSNDFEKKIVEFLLTTSSWGFPQTSKDLTKFVSNCLRNQDIKVAQFTDGVTPGRDWVLSFLERHKDKLSERMSNNIKRTRAQVSDDVIDAYFDELEKSLEGLPPKAIFNYDESNLSDDPGKKKMIFRRGVKYPDLVINHTKSSISFMMCGSADGTSLPPFVVYKAKNRHPTWEVSLLIVAKL